MQKVQVFDPALCCSSGVCGTEVDQALVIFSADVDWARQNGAQIERFNLAQQPLAFAENVVVKDVLQREGEAALPITLVDGKLALSGSYPKREALAGWLDIPLITPVSSTQPAARSTGGCCCGSASKGKCC